MEDLSKQVNNNLTRYTEIECKSVTCQFLNFPASATLQQRSELLVGPDASGKSHQVADEEMTLASINFFPTFSLYHSKVRTRERELLSANVNVINQHQLPNNISSQCLKRVHGIRFICVYFLPGCRMPLFRIAARRRRLRIGSRRDDDTHHANFYVTLTSFFR